MRVKGFDLATDVCLLHVVQLQEVLTSIQNTLEEHGIVANIESSAAIREGGQTCRMICITDDLGSSRTKLKRQSRDQAVMVRVDEETIDGLDSWIKAGVAASRSEAAALFIREGLNLRGQELAELKGSIESVERALQKLRSKARSILGDASDESGERE